MVNVYNVLFLRLCVVDVVFYIICAPFDLNVCVSFDFNAYPWMRVAGLGST